MRKHIIYFVLGLSCVLQGCSENPPTHLTVEMPLLLRAVVNNNVVADITIDSEPAVRVSFSNASPKTVTLTSIVPDQSHVYTVDWYEVVDGVELQLSQQNGVLSVSQSNPTVNLNSEHFTGYDVDGDFVENLTERRNGDCPWVTCDIDGSLTDPSTIMTVSLSNNETMTFNGGNQWTESALTTVGRNFSWRTVRISRTSIFLQDLERCTTCAPARNWLMEIDLSLGHVLFSYNEEDDAYFKLYDIEGIESSSAP